MKIPATTSAPSTPMVRVASVWLCVEDLAQKRLVRVLDSHEGESGRVSLLYRARTCVD